MKQSNRDKTRCKYVDQNHISLKTCYLGLSLCSKVHLLFLPELPKNFHLFQIITYYSFYFVNDIMATLHNNMRTIILTNK